MFLIDTLGTGGKERRLAELLKSIWLRKEIDYQLAVMSRNIHYKEVLNIGFNIEYIIRKTKWDALVFLKLYRLIRQYRPDIVHCWDSMTAVYSSPVCKLLHCKLINGMVIDTPVRQSILNKHWLRARLTFPFADMIVGNSEAGLKAYKAPQRKSTVVYPGFNFSRTENLPDKQIVKKQLGIKTGFVVGMVATFWEMKDYPTFFRAARNILSRRKDVTFIAIGSDTDSQEANNLIEKQDKNYFRLLGSRSDVEALVNIMDVCILSTFTEGTSNSILEYMALAKPVIATNGGGTREIVSDGETGFLVEPSAPAKLADKIDVLLNDNTLREKFGAAGLNRIQNVFTIDRMTSAYINIYSRLTSN